MTLPVQRIRGSLVPAYNVDRELRHGGMAIVYIAKDPEHERIVALNCSFHGLA